MAVSPSECPECHATVAVDADVMIAEIIDCVDCSTGLEVVSVDPLILALAPEIEEDWGE
ncbi:MULTISPECIES: lysine biosynthesis protein LysW [unclassified Streptomyces]|uniref:lysine biosynthesis protein LysW n=1 Tax=unclassified Streptomyces TaxID=2593676 RepID=UPI003816B6AB